MTVRLKSIPRTRMKRPSPRPVRILRAGGVVAFPTETFYGLGADARQEAAVEKIFRSEGAKRSEPHLGHRR